MARITQQYHLIEDSKLQKAKEKVKINTKRRQKERANKLQNTINEYGRFNNNNNWIIFKIKNENILTQNVLKTLELWQGGKYKTPQTNDKQCFDKARNYWCREKAKPLGTEFIYPILIQLFNHIITTINDIYIKDKLLLYFQILKNVLNIDIKFKRTSTKPLVLHAMYFKPNKFKEFCKIIVEIFNFNDDNIKWELPRVTRSVRNKGDKRATSQYIRDDTRAKKLHDSFIYCIDLIINKINQCNDQTTIFCKVNELQEKLGIAYNNNQEMTEITEPCTNINDVIMNETTESIIEPPIIPPSFVSPQYPIIYPYNYNNYNNYNYRPYCRCVCQYSPYPISYDTRYETSPNESMTGSTFTPENNPQETNDLINRMSPITLYHNQSFELHSPFL